MGFLDSFQKNMQHPNILPEEYVTDMGVAVWTAR